MADKIKNIYWKLIANENTTANALYDRTITVQDLTQYTELMFTLQRSTNGRTFASALIPITQFNDAGCYVSGSYTLYSGAMNGNSNRWINAVAIYVSNTQIELACNANDEAIKLRVWAR